MDNPIALQNADVLESLPDEIRELVEVMRAKREALIEAVGKEVGKKRDEAVTGRKASGIERIWLEDDEYYHGIDDLNREGNVFVKGSSTEGGLTAAQKESPDCCTAFFNITRQFVDAAAARMGDILLPAGDWNFAMKPTPVTDDDEMPEVVDGGQQAEAVKAARQVEVTKRVAKGEKRIHDWLVECQYHAEVRKVIEKSARIGTGILKGPVPKRRLKKKTVKNAEGLLSLALKKETVPNSYSVNPWNFYPDPNCGESIHDGQYCLELDRMSAKQLRDLKDLKGYLADQIDKVIDEGPSQKNYTDGVRTTQEQTADSEQFDVWYFYGLLDFEKLNALNVRLEEEDKKRDLIPAVVTLVNDTPIKAFLNPLDSGEFPYDVMPWQQIDGMPWGIGVARQGRTPQDMLNAATRALMDNAGMASGPMILLRRKAIIPVDGKWIVKGRKLFWVTEDADIKSVKDAIYPINIPIQQEELDAIIQLAYKMMEDSTGIFFIMQGQQGSAPDTVGGMELLNRNASALLRRLARIFDIMITEPHIRRYYEWLMTYGKEDEKGDTQIEALGSTALIERDMQGMMAMQILNLSANPAFGLDPEKAIEEVLKAARYIPDKFKMDEAKKKAIPPPTIPQIEVAKIKAAADEKKTKIQTLTQLKEMELDTDRDNVYQETMANRDAINQQSRREELMVKRELALLEYANRRGIALDQVKGELAQTAMKLKTQIRLTKAGKGPQVAEPLMEPAGRASEGRAYVE